MTQITKTVNNLEFEPVTMYGRGNQIQVAQTKYKGVLIYERTFIPWNIFKNITVHYQIDLVLPMGSEPCLSPDYYTDEGYGVPVVKTIEEAIILIDKYKSS